MSISQENSEITNKSTKPSKFKYMFLYMFLGFVVGNLGLQIMEFVLVPAHSDHSNYSARGHLGETISSLSEIKMQITENANTSGNLSGIGKEFKITPAEFSKYSAAYLNVSEDGVIVVKSKKYGQVVVFVPRMSEGKVVWKCIGAPNNMVSQNCR